MGGVTHPHPAAPSLVSLTFHVSSSVDSEKSLSPLVDDSQPFTVPFRPYAWSSYPGPGPGLWALGEQDLRPDVEVDGGPVAMTLYGDRSPHSTLFAERALLEEPFQDYRRRAAALLFPEAGLRGGGPEVKGPAELLCPSLILNGAYKCIKCRKVRSCRKTCKMFNLRISLEQQ